MKKLVVRNFSSIDFADIEFAQFTIITGPQASGKSLLCKLNFFFWDLLVVDRLNFFSNNSSLESFKDFIATKFSEWFPVSAWGDRNFTIDFHCENFEITLIRAETTGKPADNVSVRFSDDLTRYYNSNTEAFAKLFARHEDGMDDLELYLELPNLVEKSRRELLQNSNVSRQLFVPAGRSFFTSTGKALSIFEQSRTIDPFIIRFGRAFAYLKDQLNAAFVRQDAFMENYIYPRMEKILGGKLVSEQGHDYLQADDGRSIPISVLSSGQQELVPLISILAAYVRPSVRRTLIYIEEPETYLFPETQSELTEVLTSIVNRPDYLMDMVITTHSPHILAKLNNLLKAGMLANSLPEKEHGRVESIIDKGAWLQNNQLAAYAIIDKKAKSLIDADGLIVAEYLDAVSAGIADEFISLLEIETENA